MDSCTLLTLLYALGTGVLTGLIGWFLGKKDANNYSNQLKNKEYELSNLRTSMDNTLSKNNDALAVANREKKESEDSLALWKEKFSKLQMQIAEDKTKEPVAPIKKASPAASTAVTKSNVVITALKDENQQLKTKAKELQAQLKKAVATKKATTTRASKTMTADLSKKVHDQYKSEIKKLKTKLKKTKDKLVVTEKALKAKPKEIEITKSIDIETLKKMLDRAPLKKVSERVISRKTTK